MARMTDADRRRELGPAVPRRLHPDERSREVGHPTSAMSAAGPHGSARRRATCGFDFDAPKSPANDRLVFSKGHASTLLYAIYRAAGVVSDDELMHYREHGSMLEGHPTPLIPWVDVATGSLGQGLPIGVGMALAARRLEKLPTRVWVLCGDSEMAEGSMWEAFEHAAHYGLDNLTAIIDVNRLGSAARRWSAGTSTLRRQGRGVRLERDRGRRARRRGDRRRVPQAVATTGKPTVVVARTKKGRASPPSRTERLPRQAARRPGRGDRRARRAARHPRRRREARASSARSRRRRALELPRYELGAEVATRKAYGDALAALGSARPDVVALDGEVSNSTFAETFAKAHPERYFEMYIAEQQMVARRRAAGGRLAPVRVDVRGLPLARRTTSRAWRP
jgi:transketolase